MSDYTNNASGGFDAYNGEPILFMDELKQNSISYGLLLTILGNYKAQVRSRYTNTYALWNEVHITSVLEPKDIYDFAVSNKIRSKDTIEQLLRRIDYYEIHYKENDEYKSKIVSANEYYRKEWILYEK